MNVQTLSSEHGGDRVGSNHRDPDNTPPFSRLFVVCHKGTSEEELRKLFDEFGNIEYCRLLRDRETNQSKGVCYVKYEKASQAALAIEALNGIPTKSGAPPLKVQVAEAKGAKRQAQKQYSNEPEDTPPRSRLFVVCPRDMTQAELRSHFEPFGHLEYCKVMTDRVTNMSKGFSYVKFSKASAAAFAMERLNETGRLGGRKVKVLIADPKAKRDDSHHDQMYGGHYYGNYGGPMHHGMQQQYPPSGGAGYHPSYGVHPHMMYGHPQQGGALYAPMYAPPVYDPSTGYYVDPAMVQPGVLFVVCSKRLTDETLAWLFSAYGILRCEIQRDQRTHESKGCALVCLPSFHAAELARQQFDGSEYPPGCVLRVMHCQQGNGIAPAMQRQRAALPAGRVEEVGSSDVGPAGSIVPSLSHEARNADGEEESSSPHSARSASPEASPPGRSQATASSPSSAHAQFIASTTVPAPAVVETHVTKTWGAPFDPKRVYFLLSRPLDEPVLVDIFSRFGTVVRLQRASRGDNGCVTFKRVDEAVNTMTNLSEVVLNGQTVQVRMSAERFRCSNWSSPEHAAPAVHKGSPYPQVRRFVPAGPVSKAPPVETSPSDETEKKKTPVSDWTKPEHKNKHRSLPNVRQVPNVLLDAAVAAVKATQEAAAAKTRKLKRSQDELRRSTDNGGASLRCSDELRITEQDLRGSAGDDCGVVLSTPPRSISPNPAVGAM